MTEIATTLVSAVVSAKPDPSGLPGSDVVGQLVNGLFFYTLMACLGAMLIGAALWAFASRSSNTHQASIGRTGLVAGFFGALLAGAAPALVNFAEHLGGQVH
jgi:Family of unknown function (DUF6112)